MNQHLTKGFNENLDNKRFEIIKPYLCVTGCYSNQNVCVEVGSGNAHMTRKLLPLFYKVISFEPDRELNKMSTMDVVQRSHTDYKIKIEDCEQDIKANCVICCNVLEHISDTTKFLEKVKSFGYSDSTFIFSVPNSHSHNRKMAFEIGLTNDPSDLDKQDISVGHKKMYDYFEFKNLIQNNGFHVSKIFSQGYKPFPNSMMEKLPKEIKDYCLKQIFGIEGAEIFAVARLK